MTPPPGHAIEGLNLIECTGFVADSTGGITPASRAQMCSGATRSVATRGHLRWSVDCAGESFHCPSSNEAQRTVAVEMRS